MKYLIIKLLSQPVFIMGESPLTRHIWIFDACICAIMFSFFFIIERFEEVLHGGKLFKIPKQFQQKNADRIIGPAPERVLMSDNRPYKRKIDEGGEKTGEAPCNSAIRMDSDMPRLEGVSGEPEFLWLWKRTIMFVMDFNANTIELFDDIANGKWRQISQSLPPFG